MSLKIIHVKMHFMSEMCKQMLRVFSIRFCLIHVTRLLECQYYDGCIKMESNADIFLCSLTFTACFIVLEILIMAHTLTTKTST